VTNHKIHVCVSDDGRALVKVPRVADASVAHDLRKNLMASVNALPDHIVDVTFDLSGTEVLDEAGAAVIDSVRRHAFLLGLHPRPHAMELPAERVDVAGPSLSP
jgi:hypothetical protein